MSAEQIFNGPIPGQSLTQDPEMRGPWEMPPKFNTPNQAIDHLFKVVTSRGFIKHLDNLLSEDKKFYIDEIASGMLSEGFMQGLWTVDVMMLLVEPLITLLIWDAAQLNLSPSFSNDTGYEDRTGFEDLTRDLVESDEVPEAPEETLEEPEATRATSPLTSNIPSSPLTGGL